MPAFAHVFYYFFFYFLNLLQRAALYYTNLQNDLEIKNSYLLFNMPADKPLVDSCKVYSNVAFRAAAASSFLRR